VLEPEDRDRDQPMEEWLKAHTAATTQTVAPVWDPRTGSWVQTPTPARRPKLPRSTLRAALAGGIVGAIVAAAVAIPVARLAAPDAPSPVTVRQQAPEAASDDDGAISIVDIASRARPWVVNINVGTTQQTPFGDVQVSGTGSGVILRSDGHIITNAHVVEGSGAVEVTLASGDKLSAQIVGTDVETDVAVIKVDRTDLPGAVLGTVKDVQVGETAVAIGSPLGLEQSVTAGIISALGRRVERGDQTPLFDMIQTDAPVTQGNSGGALVDGSGAVVGINAAIAASPEVGAEGIAFAIPVDVAVAVAEELINSGRATHPWLGIEGESITPRAAEEFGVEQGAFIRRVVDGGPAARAGVRANDIVVSFAGERIESMDDLVVAIREHRVGEQVELEVVRAGDRVTLRATLGDKPADL
jgi:putative serine protease PepD